MDRALWKAKTVSDNEWFQGWFSLDKQLGHHMYVISDDYGNGENVYKETLCQCTGLKDKNGQLIFEGDEVRVWGGESYYGCWEHDATYFVKADIENQYTNAFAFGESEFVELTGKNIHDKESD